MFIPVTVPSVHSFRLFQKNWPNSSLTTTQQAGWSNGNNLKLYSGDSRFSSGPGHLPFWLRIFVDYPSLSRQILRQYFNWGTTAFLQILSSSLLINESPIWLHRVQELKALSNNSEHNLQVLAPKNRPNQQNYFPSFQSIYPFSLYFECHSPKTFNNFVPSDHKNWNTGAYSSLMCYGSEGDRRVKALEHEEVREWDWGKKKQ